MDVLQVVRQLRDLTANPQNRATIVRDEGCLPGLVVFLDNANPEVVATALEALHYLAEVPSNRALMRNEVGLVISLRNIIRRSSEYDPRIVSLAQIVHDLLIPPVGSVASSRSLTLGRTPSKRNTFLGASNRKARIIILQIAGLKDEETKEMVEEQFLGIKGVISFTIDVRQQRCTVRARSDIKPEVLCRAVSGTRILTAQQVVKNELGEEVLLSFSPNPDESTEGGKENKQPVKIPDYLPEEDVTGQSQDDGKALEKSGAVEGGGWFNSVTGFLGKAFYW